MKQLGKPVKSKIVCRSEHAEQCEIAAVLRYAQIFFTALPNGGKRNVITGAKLKREGVVAGAPDILIFERPPNAPQYVGTALEMKREKGSSTSPEQLEFHEKLRAQGWLVIIAKGAEVARRELAAVGYRVPVR